LKKKNKELKSLQEINYKMNEENEIIKQNNKNMEIELISLASRNSILEKDKEDLNQLLEQTVYELEIKEKHLEFIGNESNNENNEENTLDNLSQQMNEYEENKQYEHEYEEENEEEEQVEEIEVLNPEEPNIISIISPLSMTDDKTTNKNNLEKVTHHPLNELKKRHEEIMKNVPNVVREYLHLTATVAKLKYPKVNINSEELILKVKDLSFIDYYDHMIRIMKNEDSKVRKLEYEQQQEIATRQRSKSMGLNTDHKDSNDKSNSLTRENSFFSKFAKLFSGNNTPSTATSTSTSSSNEHIPFKKTKIIAINHTNIN